MNNKPFTAALEILEPGTDKVLSRRVVGQYDSEYEASEAAFKVRQPNETVCVGVPFELFNESEELSCREMAEIEVDWMLLHGEL